MTDIYFLKNPIPMWIYDLESLQFLEVNEAAQVVYKFSREEFLSMTIKDIRPEEDIPKLLAIVNNGNIDYIDAGFWRHKKKNGEIFVVQIISQRIEFEGRKAELILSIDQTERYDSIQKLNKSESRLNSILQSMTDVVWSFDPVKHIFLFISKDAKELYGYETDEFYADPELWKLCIHPDDRDYVLNCFFHLIENPSYEIEYRIITKKNEIKIINERVTLIKNAVSNEPERIDIITRDITSQKENLKNIDSLTKLLQKQNEQLKELAFINSHKIRGPLTSIIGAIEIMPELKDQKSVFDQIRKSAMELESVINDIHHKFINNDSAQYLLVQPERKISTIMHVDDDILQLTIVKKMIQKMAPEVSLVSHSNPELALLDLRKKVPDLLFLDLNMPIIDGWDFLNFLIRENINPLIYILSSSIDPIDIQKAEMYKIVKGYLSKPLTIPDVKKILSIS